MKSFYFLIAYILVGLFASDSLSAQTIDGYTNAFRTFVNPDTVTVNTRQKITFNIVNDTTNILPNTLFKIILPKQFISAVWDGKPLTIPALFAVTAGYTKAVINTTKQQTINNIQPSRDEFIGYTLQQYLVDKDAFGLIATIKLIDTFKIGDTLQIVHGAGLAQSYINVGLSKTTDFFATMCNFGNTNFKIIRDRPILHIKEENFGHKINLVLQSTAKANESALLKIMLTDQFYNTTPTKTGIIQVSCNTPYAIVDNYISISNDDKGVKDLYVKFTRDGVYTCSCQFGNKVYTSNPIHVSDDSIKIYWGDFHTHTEFSRDGRGSGAYDYTRNSEGLDFFSITDHIDGGGTDYYGINDQEWYKIKLRALEYHQPNRYITFVGYENSMPTPSQHNNMIFNFKDEDIWKIPRWGNKIEYNNVLKIYASADTVDTSLQVLTIPHHTGKCFACLSQCTVPMQFGNQYYNKKYRRIYEIYSSHGLSEYYDDNHPLSYKSNNPNACGIKGSFIQDAWSKRERVGIIGSCDGHIARSAFRDQAGGAAIFADSLNRNNLFQHLYNRNAYATTGERIVLKFNIYNKMMGDELLLNQYLKPVLEIFVAGTNEIEYVDVVKWDFTNNQYINGVPKFNVIKRIQPQATNNRVIDFSFMDSTYSDTSMYYIRAKQKNKVNNIEVWAWSSPIWVDKDKTTSNIFPKDSIFNFNVDANYCDAILTWKVKNEINIKKYNIYKSSNDTSNFSLLKTISAKNNLNVIDQYQYNDNNSQVRKNYYKLEAITFSDSIFLVGVDSIYLLNCTDSILYFNVEIGNKTINVDWLAQQKNVQKYIVQKAKIYETLDSLTEVLANNSVSENYNYKDFFPIKDSSIYRIVMQLPNGQIKYSNIDTLYYIMDSIIDFHATLSDGVVYLTWKNIHEYETESMHVEKHTEQNHLFETMMTIVPEFGLFDTLQYEITDNLPDIGWNYYRIKHTLPNNKILYTYTDSVNVLNTPIKNNFNTQQQFTIIDNLIPEGKHQLLIKTNTDELLEGNIAVVDVTGKLYQVGNLKISQNEEYKMIDIPFLNTGVYYLIFQTKDQIFKSSFMVMMSH
ncbi:MAG: hypothetical protein IPK18_03005 [Sphingobacteriales bacterium]|nr:MAG: hypothetical protein IPK18_03005 [Sphingobacteriales bacterium]